MTYLDELCRSHPTLKELRLNLQKAYELLAECVRGDGTIYTCGNGGSAADAEHIVGELMKCFLLPRPISVDYQKDLESVHADIGTTLASKLQQGIRAVSLVSGVSLPSAIANDVSADFVFAQQISCLGRRGDVLWAISTSGNSSNINYALVAARALGVKTLGLTGGDGGEMATLCDVELRVPASNTPKIQELHLPIYHALCAAIEAEIFSFKEQ